MVKDNGDFAEELIRDVSYKAQKNIYKLLSMTQKKMPGRVAEVLLYLADKVFEEDKFTMILIPSGTCRDVSNGQRKCGKDIKRILQTKELLAPVVRNLKYWKEKLINDL